jgi:hypothetical protein
MSNLSPQFLSVGLKASAKKTHREVLKHRIPELWLGPIWYWRSWDGFLLNSLRQGYSICFPSISVLTKASHIGSGTTAHPPYNSTEEIQVTCRSIPMYVTLCMHMYFFKCILCISIPYHWKLSHTTRIRRLVKDHVTHHRGCSVNAWGLSFT